MARQPSLARPPLRFRLYPLDSELALQLSLTCWPRVPLDHIPISRPDLLLATQSVETQLDVASRLRWCMQRGSDPSGQSPESVNFHRSIASILHGYADKYEELPLGSPPRSNLNPYPPVVLTTAYDQLLEEAILDTAQDSQPSSAVTVIAPVGIVKAGLSDLQVGHLAWVYATVTPHTGDAAANRKALEKAVWNWFPFGQGRWPIRQGVSVVHLNGAPTFKSLDGNRLDFHRELEAHVSELSLVGTSRDLGFEDAIVRHALVISESEVLQTIGNEQTTNSRLPDFLKMATAVSYTNPEPFGDPAANTGMSSQVWRRVFLLGHLAEQWGMRSRVLARMLLKPYEFVGDAHRGHIDAQILGDADRLRLTSLLSWADVKGVEGSLEWLTECILQPVVADLERAT